MKLVCMSDTHGLIPKCKIPDGDVLIHSGDFMNTGINVIEIIRFNNWFSLLPHKHKIIVPGNHDVYFERLYSYARSFLDKDIKVLIDEEYKINNIKFYGSPWQPAFNNWAFNLPRNGHELEEKWDMIPLDADVLITHSPPYGILDTITQKSKPQGCKKLYKKIMNDLKLRLHVFGHIHGSGSKIVEIKQVDGTKISFINSAICTEAYKPTNKPVVFKL